MFSKNNQKIPLIDLVSKIDKLTNEKFYIIHNSTHEVTVGRRDEGFYLIDPNLPLSTQTFSNSAQLIDKLKKALHIKENANVYYSSIITPKILDELDPSLKKIFTNKDDLKHPLKTLAKAAGLKDEPVSQHQLIEALAKQNVKINVTDIAKLHALSQTLSTHSEKQLSPKKI